MRSVAKAERMCDHCHKPIPAGSVYEQHVYRERALSYREAMHAGTMYPTRVKRRHIECTADSQETRP